jgi:hypothetical protein
MNSNSFNPINFLVSLAVGWFLLAFLHAAAVSLFSAAWGNLIPRFQAIALFHDRRGAAIDIGIIVVVGVIANMAWYLAHRP